MEKERQFKSTVTISFSSLNHRINKKSCELEELLRGRADAVCKRSGANPIYEINFSYQITIENVKRIIRLIFGKSWYIADKYAKIRIDVEELKHGKSAPDRTTKSLYSLIYTPMN